MNRKLSILAVDDEPQNIKIFKEIFDASYNLQCATSGDEALSLMETFKPDVVLLDIMMPGMNGYEVCNRIRQDKKHQYTKTVFVSAKAMTQDRLKGYETGANDYVTKPFNDEELIAKVSSLAQLKYRQELDELRSNLFRFFIAELRSPLNSIMGFSMLLAQCPVLNETERTYLTHIDHGGKSLLNLSEKLLIYHDLLNRGVLNKSSISIESLCNDLTENLNDNHGLVSIDMHDIKSQRIECDRGMIVRALFCLIENINTISDHQHGANVVFSFSDQLLKIVVSSEQVVVDFNQVKEVMNGRWDDASITLDHGFIFNLWIVAIIVKLHQGNIELDHEQMSIKFIMSIPV